MMWVLSIVIVLAMGGVAAVAVGRGAPMAPEHPDRPDVLLPADGPLVAADLRTVRFPVVLRGYRMAEVDALLDRLAAQLEDRRDEGPDDRPDAARHDEAPLDDRLQPEAQPAETGRPEEA